MILEMWGLQLWWAFGNCSAATGLSQESSSPVLYSSHINLHPALRLSAHSHMSLLDIMLPLTSKKNLIIRDIKSLNVPTLKIYLPTLC